MLEAKAFLLSPAELGVLISLKHIKEDLLQNNFILQQVQFFAYFEFIT